MFGTESCLQATLPSLPYGYSNGLGGANAGSCRLSAGNLTTFGTLQQQPQQQQQQQQQQPSTQQCKQVPPPPPPPQPHPQHESFDFDDEAFDEDVDDDDFTEEEYNQMDVQHSSSSNNNSNHPPDVSDITHQLLQFADLVNNDIQKYFGRKKGDKDSVDIYEDRWKSSGKSGRELYYADLLRMARGGGGGGEEGEDSKANCRSNVETSRKSRDSKEREEYSGRMDQKVGLGPFVELFHYGLRQYVDDRKLAKFSKKIKRLQTDGKKLSDTVPMHDRRFPESFWKEPSAAEVLSSGNQTVCNSHSAAAGHGSNKNKANGLLNLSKPLDFTDLLESWNVDDTDEMSSGDLSATSPESDKN